MIAFHDWILFVYSVKSSHLILFGYNVKNFDYCVEILHLVPNKVHVIDKLRASQGPNGYFFPTNNDCTPFLQDQYLRYHYI